MEKCEWYALHVRPRFEYLVAFRLKQRGVEHYFPSRLITRQSDNGPRSIEVPLFPGFVFCKAHPAVHRSLLTIPGILDIVRGTATTDGTVSEQSIENLKRIVNAGLAVQPWPFTSSGKRVTVGKGPLKGVSGILDDSAPARVFIVSIDSICRSLAIEVDHQLTFSSGARVGTAA
jgi:transcription antitermination factor NusG